MPSLKQEVHLAETLEDTKQSSMERVSLLECFGITVNIPTPILSGSLIKEIYEANEPR